MKKFLVLLSFLATVPVFAADVNAPERIERTSYLRWLHDIGSNQSPYESAIFAWYEEQRNAPLPAEVAADPDHLFVTVDRPLAKTIELEEAGDVNPAVTYGLETYGILDADIQTTLETILFRWGKPVGATEGVTYPTDTVYGSRQESLNLKWGPSSYRTITKKSGGGVAKDMNDVFSLLVREDGAGGYDLIGNFFGPNGGRNQTQTTSSITIISIRPTNDGKTEYRVAGFQTGQSYSFFGIEFGRRNFGFNRDRIRTGQKEFFDQVAELKNTGKITERRPK